MIRTTPTNRIPPAPSRPFHHAVARVAILVALIVVAWLIEMTSW